VNKGSVLLKLKWYAEALGAAERAIQLDPTDAEAYRIKGHALRKLKCYMDALGVYERLLALNPNLELAWYNKAEMLRHLGRSKEAKQTYAIFRRMAQRRGMGW
jgi:tetratricopeptide (TPR) repeat protein